MTVRTAAAVYFRPPKEGFMLRTIRVLFAALLVATPPVIAQSIPAADAGKHIGEQATVCGNIAGKHVVAQSRGAPTFIDIDRPYPHEPFTVVFWERDRASVGTLPSSGRLCVTGFIEQYRGGAQIVLHAASSWSAPKSQPAQPTLSNDRSYTNTDGQQVHSPAYSSGGVPAGATAVCGDGTYSFSQHRQGTCSHHGGVSRWL